jgi:hypothetical protein
MTRKTKNSSPKKLMGKRKLKNQHARLSSSSDRPNRRISAYKSTVLDFPADDDDNKVANILINGANNYSMTNNNSIKDLPERKASLSLYEKRVSEGGTDNIKVNQQI